MTTVPRVPRVFLEVVSEFDEYEPNGAMCHRAAPKGGVARGTPCAGFVVARSGTRGTHGDRCSTSKRTTVPDCSGTLDTDRHGALPPASPLAMCSDRHAMTKQMFGRKMVSRGFPAQATPRDRASKVRVATKARRFPVTFHMRVTSKSYGTLPCFRAFRAGAGQSSRITTESASTTIVQASTDSNGNLARTTALGVVALPVHDSAIVARQHKGELREAMEVAYREHVGYEPRIEGKS